MGLGVASDLMGVLHHNSFHHRSRELPEHVYTELGNSDISRSKLDLLSEVREQAWLREQPMKQRMSMGFNYKVIQWSFNSDDLVMIRNDIGTTKPGDGKLAPNWKGPYKVT
ncbi:hypothetical protein PIB30_037990 [Stylosanthes scabra]|uniref:Uncharacterized protein n=1 Tax=Stylosanthes scabra TaxID=79078 RepID=A0ABU6ZBG1_9FABA|nr:hypothetical protein [Stylosanthes scabra]